MTTENAETKPAETPATTPTDTPPPVDEPAAVTSPPVDNFSEIGGAYVEEWPERVDHFAAQVRAEDAEKQEAKEFTESGHNWRSLKDKNGHYYDPDLCSGKIDPATAMPEKTTRGMWVLRRGVKRSQLKKTPPKMTQQAETQKATEAACAAEAEAATKAKAAISTSIIMGLFMQVNSALNGADVVEEVMKKELTKVMLPTGQVKPFSVYEAHMMTMQGLLEQHGGGPDLPPWLQVAAVFGGSTAVMFFNRKHAERRQTFKEKAGLLWLRIRGKKEEIAKRMQKKEQPEKAQEVTP